MKYLKLDARHSECRGLARALAGSHGEYDGYIKKLLAVHDDYFLIEFQTVVGDFWKVKEICLTLDTLKLCPFVAMREGVVFKYELGFCVNRAPMFSKTDLFSDIAKLSWTIKGLEQVALDLDNLPKGAEVVEL